MLSILVSGFVRTNKDGYENIIAIYDEIISQDDKEITLNFANCQRFDANLSSALGAILDTLTQQKYNIYLKNMRPGVRKTLSRNSFLKAIGYGVTLDDKETFIPYRRFKVDEANTFKEYINTELIGKQKFPKHTDLAGKYISTNIYEIFINAAFHGDCGHIYCCGEYYPNEDIPKLRMTIVDYGNTMYGNVCKYFTLKGKKENVTPDYAIKWAIIEGNTTKETTGGLGLSCLMDFIKMNKGEVHIVSSKGILIYKDDVIHTELLAKAFPGTIVNMEFNFDDNNLYYMSDEKIDLNNLL